jgi:signal transduction histidine kinase
MGSGPHWEGLANVAKQRAATRADVTLTRTGTLLIMQIRDNGRGGADPRMRRRPRTDPARGIGLTGLADRGAALGGRLPLAGPAGRLCCAGGCQMA